MTSINFTNSPSNNDTITVGGVTYIYSSSSTRWEATSGGTGTGLTAEQVQDVVGNQLVTNASHTGISFAYDDAGDGALDATIGTLNQNTTGSAATLTTARTIGGVSFDGSANINLPGVNAAGTQNTTGSAATLTTARTIGGVSFDGSANINLPGVNAAGTQNTTGTAATVTGATQAAITSAANLVTVGTIGTGVWQGTAIASGYIAADAITGAKIADNAIDSEHYVDGSIDTAHIADDQVTAAKLANTAVTAAAYGSSSAIPVLTIDAQGRITAASTAATSSVLTIAADSGSNDTVTVGTDTLTFEGTANEIETTVSDNKINLGLPTNVTIAGNLTVAGTQTTVSSTTITVADPLVALASNNNTADAVDIGLYGLYDTSGSQDLYSGLFRDASDSGKWKLFKDTQAVPTTTVNTSGTGYAVGTLVAALEGNVTGNVTGSADTLTTARTIGGVSFDGSANIDLPGVNAAGTQNTTGTAATVTGAAQTAITSVGTLTGLAVSGNQTVGGTLGVTGVISPTTHIDMPDNAKLLLGTGDDLQIYHDGSDSVIADTGTGNLSIRAEDFYLMNPGGTEIMIRADIDGAVKLYYDNAVKIETSAAGVAVTGTLSLPTFTIPNSIGSSGQVLKAPSSGTTLEWGAVAAGGSTITAADSAPGSPSSGDIWWDSDDLTPYIYYNDGSSSQWVELVSKSSGVTDTEAVQDIVGAMFTSNTETGITATYQDSDGTLDLVVTDLDTEAVQDIVGAMFSSNTETGITATYQDSDGTLDLVVPTNSEMDEVITWYNANIKGYLATVSQHGTSWGSSGVVAESGLTGSYTSSTKTWTTTGTGSNFQAYAPEHNFLNTSNWSEGNDLGPNIWIKIYFTNVSGNISNRKAIGFAWDNDETGNNLPSPNQTALDNYILVRGDGNSVNNASVDESNTEGWTTYFNPGTFSSKYAAMHFNRTTGKAIMYLGDTETGTYTKWADKTFSTIPKGLYALAWRRTAGQHVTMQLIDATKVVE